MSSSTVIAERAERLIEPAAAQMGLELVQVLFRREQDGWVLRVLVDRIDSQPGAGVTIQDCALLSREISDLLDVEDLVAQKYRLEVSSPGLDRPLCRPADFTRFAGKQVKLRTCGPIDGRRNFRGQLIGLEEDGTVVLDVDGVRHRLPRSDIEKANLVPEI
ncbi:MAG: ribosome maturation factor RimP [Deltaproteobacteria bacterium]|nr:ribosome maturation factor RimP [Deltaproteobacteria bacterium]